MTSRSADYYCKKCGDHMFSHYDGPFTDDPPTQKICKKCENKLRFGVGKRRFRKRRALC